MSEVPSGVLHESSLKGRWYPEAFKRAAVRLVADEKYTFNAAATFFGGPTVARFWRRPTA